MVDSNIPTTTIDPLTEYVSYIEGIDPDATPAALVRDNPKTNPSCLGLRGLV